MIQKMINRMVEKQVQEQVIDFKEKNIYKYGYILVFEVVLNVILAIMIGYISHNLGEILFFLCCYIPLRSFCGGWHAGRIWSCTIVSNIILVVEVLCLKYISNYINMKIILLLFIFELLLIIFFAPLETSAKKISKIEKENYRMRIKCILLIHVMVMAIMIFLKSNTYIFIIVYVYGVQIVMLLLEKMKQLTI